MQFPLYKLSQNPKPRLSYTGSLCRGSCRVKRLRERPFLYSFLSLRHLRLRTVEDACPYNHFGIVSLFFFLFSLLIGIAFTEPRDYRVVFVIQEKIHTADNVDGVLFIWDFLGSRFARRLAASRR